MSKPNLFKEFSLDLVKFKSDLLAFSYEADESIPIKSFPCLSDDVPSTPFDSHYLYHVTWALEGLARGPIPSRHHDFGSSLYFIGGAAQYCDVTFHDFRPPRLFLRNVSCCHANLTELELGCGEIQIASCMHVIEHIGLGRYGDPISYKADKVEPWVS